MRLISAVTFLLAVFVSAPVFAARLHHAPILRHQTHHDANQGQQPARKPETRQLDNQYFSITLPEGWSLGRPVRPVADRVSAEFKKGSNIRISLNVFSVPFTPQLMAEKTAENMRKRGMEVSQPVERDGLYVVDISKKGVTGKGWFGGNGKTGASTIIFAPDLNEANELLEALKPKISGIIPGRVN